MFSILATSFIYFYKKWSQELFLLYYSFGHFSPSSHLFSFTCPPRQIPSILAVCSITMLASSFIWIMCCYLSWVCYTSLLSPLMTFFITFIVYLNESELQAIRSMRRFLWRNKCLCTEGPHEWVSAPTPAPYDFRGIGTFVVQIDCLGSSRKVLVTQEQQ